MISSKKFETEAEWLEFRKQGIGGSEAASLFNESPYMTRTDLAHYKQGKTEYQSNAILGFGTRMEEIIFNQFVLRDFPKAVSSNNECFVNDKWPLLQASPDAYTDDQVIEIKFVNLLGSAKWKGKDGNYELPRHYWHQVQHYMAVLEKSSAVVYAFFQELNDAVALKIEKDESYVFDLNSKSQEFFNTMDNSNPEPVVAINLTEKLLVDINILTKDIKSLEAKKKELVQTVLNKYGDGTTLTYNNLKGKIYRRGQNLTLTIK